MSDGTGGKRQRGGGRKGERGRGEGRRREGEREEGTGKRVEGRKKEGNGEVGGEEKGRFNRRRKRREGRGEGGEGKKKVCREEREEREKARGMRGLRSYSCCPVRPTGRQDAAGFMLRVNLRWRAVEGRGGPWGWGGRRGGGWGLTLNIIPWGTKRRFVVGV